MSSPYVFPEFWNHRPWSRKAFTKWVGGHGTAKDTILAWMSAVVMLTERQGRLIPGD